MSLAALIRQMADAGASAEVIALAVEALEQKDAAIEARRAKDRDRKAASRAEKAVTIHGNSTESPQTVQGVSGETVSSPPSPKIIKTLSTPSSEKTPRATKATQLADGWEPNATGWQFAVGRLGEQRARTELAKLGDWAKATGATKRDWDATWRNWVRSAAERTPQARAGPSGRRLTAGDVYAAALNGSSHDQPANEPSFIDITPGAAGFGDRSAHSFALEPPRKRANGGQFDL